MTREAKVGLMMIAVVIGVFGFLIYKRMHRPTEVFAEQIRQEEATANDDRRDPDFSEAGNATRQFDHDPLPDRRRERRQTVKELESAAEKVVDFTDAVVEDVDPSPKDRRNREKPSMPVDLSANDDDFGQFQARRDSSRDSRKIQSPDPADDAFDMVSEQRVQPPRNLPANDETPTSDPFGSDSSSPPLEPVRFDEPTRRDRNVPNPDDGNDGNSSRGFRSSSAPSDGDVQMDEPRRGREFDAGFEPAPRGKRRADPAAVLDDAPSSNSAFLPTSSGDGQSYVVQQNDTLWSIARKRYGAGRYYKALASHNQQTISDPKMLKPGDVILIPDVAILEKRYAETISRAPSADFAPSVTTAQARKLVDTASSGYFVAADGVPMYRVGEQDTLTGIAKSHLGRTTRWVQILEMNRNVLRDGNELTVGMVLRLPADASRVQVVGTPRDIR